MVLKISKCKIPKQVFLVHLYINGKEADSLDIISLHYENKLSIKCGRKLLLGSKKHLVWNSIKTET